MSGRSVLPTFLVIGAMKAGTTSLYAYLKPHPQVFLPENKELDYFVAEINWKLGRAWYQDVFAPGAGFPARGEASPTYAMAHLYAGVPERIRSVIPDAKLVYLVRHPIERMRSMYLHRVSYGRESRPIDEALEHDSDYLDTSRYAWQLEHYLPHFGREQIRVVQFERLRDDREDVLTEILEFLGVDPAYTSPTIDEVANRTADKRVHGRVGRVAARLPFHRVVAERIPAPVKSAYRRVVTKPVPTESTRIDPSLRSRLETELAADVRRLASFLPPGFDGWGLV